MLAAFCSHHTPWSLSKQELLDAIGLGTERTSGLRVLPAGKMKLKEQSRPCVSKFTTRTLAVTDVFDSGRNDGPLRPGRRVGFR